MSVKITDILDGVTEVAKLVGAAPGPVGSVARIAAMAFGVAAKLAKAGEDPVKGIERLLSAHKVVAGVHEAIVESDLWDVVQERLQSNNGGGGSQARNRTGAILRGLVYCGRCGSSMLHTFTTKPARRHRYYVCSRHHNEGAARCPKARVPAGEFEKFVAVPKGEPENFLTAGEMRAKFDGLTAPYLSAQNREALAGALLSLEAMDDIGALLRLSHPQEPALAAAGE